MKCKFQVVIVTLHAARKRSKLNVCLTCSTISFLYNNKEEIIIIIIIIIRTATTTRTKKR